MAAIELVVITAWAKYDGQSHGYRLTCQAEDWDKFEWMRQHYSDTVVRQVRQSVPAHVGVWVTTRRETLGEDGS